MGKSLVIKGADFSANGIPVEVILGTLTKENTSALLNAVFLEANIKALNPSTSTIKVLLGTDDATADASMTGKTVSYIKSASPYVAYGSGLWGRPFEITLSNLGNVICQSTETNAFENVEVWLKVIEG